MDSTVPDHVALAKRALSHWNKSAGERELSDLQPLFDLMADDVVFKVAVPADTPVYGAEIRGKPAVIHFYTLADIDQVEDVEIDGPVEYFSNGNRVVVLAAQSYRIKKSGRIVRNKEFATVIDFRDGLIVRILSIEDCSEFIADSKALDQERVGLEA